MPPKLKPIILLTLMCGLVFVLVLAARHAIDSRHPGVSGVPAHPINVLTFHGDNARLGWNRQETILTPGNVDPDHFGKLWENQLDGQVYGSPVYVSGLTLKGQKHDVVYAATEGNSVYALDAATGESLWERKELAHPLNVTEFTGCPMIWPKHGITSTPVIDLQSGTIYVCGAAQPKVRQLYKVWALDITTGAVKPGWPITIQGSYHGCVFEAGQLVQRGALSLVNGWLYVPFGARCDIGDWHGWVAGVDTAHPSAPQRLFTCAPTGEGGGIWSAAGVAADNAGNLYAAAGNGEYSLDEGGEDISQCVVRLVPAGNALNFSRKPGDYYVPANHAHLDDADEDLGGSGVLVLPDQAGTGTPHLLLTAGKDGLMYLLNRDNLGGVGGELQKQRLFGDPNAAYHANIRATPAYFDAGAAGRFVYISGTETGPLGEKGLVALRLGATGQSGAGKTALTEAWTLRAPVENPGSPVVSSNGDQNAIVWLIVPPKPDNKGPGSLSAYNALTGNRIYDTEKQPGRDAIGGSHQFSSPTVANGRVFVGADGIVAYGLLNQSGEKGK